MMETENTCPLCHGTGIIELPVAFEENGAVTGDVVMIACYNIDYHKSQKMDEESSND